MPRGSPALMTRGLVVIALNVLVVSLLFTVNDVQISLGSTFQWCLRTVAQFPRVQWLVNKGRALVGLGKLTLPKTVPPPSPPPAAAAAKAAAKKPQKTMPNLDATGAKVLSGEQLALFDGTRPSKPVYLALLGRVYNVERGRKHYARGGSYHFFAGRDATRAFVTGDFSARGLVDNVDGFSAQELLSLADWINFYARDYEFVGVVEGRYYGARGRLTAYGQEVRDKLAAAYEFQKEKVRENEVFPACNSEWQQTTGTRVWCTAKSGGVEREWVGVPRRLYAPGSKSFRCACVKNYGPPLASASAEGNVGDLHNANIKDYPSCSPTANSCKLGKADGA